MNSKSKKAFAERLALLLAWRETAMWYAGEPGPMRAIARQICDDAAILIDELSDEIVALCATPAERKRSAARAARAAVRSEAKISHQWQQRTRRDEHLADQREAARDRACAMARVWRAL